MRQNSDALQDRIAFFKSDPENLKEANEFIDDLIQQATKEVESRQGRDDKDNLNDDNVSDLGNIKKRLGRARGFVLRMFDALCNCTQTAATAARSHVRNHPFTKR